MILTITLFALFTLILVWVARQYADKSVLFFLISGWVIKCIAGFAFIYVYTYYYGNGELSEDAGAYFREAKILAEIKQENPSDFYSIFFEKKNSEELIANYFQKIPNSRISRHSSGLNDTRIHIKFIALLMLSLGTNYLAIFLLFFFLSYLGFITLWLNLKDKIQVKPLLSLGLILLPPNLLFWTSSNLKEVLFILGLCLLLAYYFTDRKGVKAKLMGIIGIVLLLLFKPILLLIILMSWGIAQFVIRGIVKKQILYIATFIGLLAISFAFSLPQKALKTLSDKQFDFINVARGGIQVKGDTSFYFISSEYENKIKIHDSIVTLNEAIPVVSNLFGKIRNETKLTIQPNNEKLNLIYRQTGGGSYFEITPLNNSWINLFISAPEALLNAFFRPFFWEKGSSKTNGLFFLENIFFFVLFFITIFRLKKIRKSDYILVITCLLSILTLSFIIGISTPISGALVRYRIPIQLLIIIVFLLTTIKHERAK